ncbi:MAG: VCBS repeat-containing protein [Bacteroidetes bacterium]|nr:VCBS repeat-containing protein [Bacteroidota bacterium]
MKTINSIIIALVISTNALAQTPISFQTFQSYAIGSQPEIVAIGDLNNDNLNDVVLGTSASFPSDSLYDNKIFVFQQNASGILNPFVKYDGRYIKTIDVADVNNDLRNDVIISFGDSIGILYQNSSGTLDPLLAYYSGTNTDAMKAGDLNSDGLTDIATGHWQSNYIRVFYQQTAGGFTSSTYSITAAGYDEIEIADATGDGKNDVILMRGQTFSIENIAIFPQDPAGGLLPPIFNDLGNINTKGVAVGDVNNDGANDIVVTHGGNQPNTFISIWLQNDPSGNPVTYPCYDAPQSVEIADLNCDGLKDVIVANGGWMNISVYAQNTSGTLNPYQLFPTPYSPYKPQSLAVGDINDDGLRDVVLAGQTSQSLVVLYNNTSCTPNSVEENTNENFPIVFPNPNNGIFNIQLYNDKSLKEISIQNIIGETVYRAKTFDIELKIDVGECNTGVYFLYIRTKNESSANKIFITR